jgi:hypothetical protein
MIHVGIRLSARIRKYLVKGITQTFMTTSSGGPSTRDRIYSHFPDANLKT